MKRIFQTVFAILLFFAAAPAASAQEPQEPDVDKIISVQLETLTRLFKLDDVQVFFIDSILQHNYPAMIDEINETRKTGANNDETYQTISDKWMEATDNAFERVFNEDQWVKYMKSTYGKEKKRREKRMKERGL